VIIGCLKISALRSRGITEKIQLTNGPVVSLDAGVTVELVTVQNSNILNDQSNILNDQIVSTNGPHPEAASGGSLFCEVVPQALGIT
jgi:hypothetical protein